MNRPQMTNKAPKMTRTHFKYIAEIISTLDCGPSVFNERLNIATHFAVKLAHCNPNFKYQTFIDACNSRALELYSDLPTKKDKSKGKSNGTRSKHLPSRRHAA